MGTSQLRPEHFELSPIKAIELAATHVPGAVSLAQGIPSFATPKVITDFVQEQIAAGKCDRYSLTTGLTELREEIALALQEEGLRYDPEKEIIVTAGSIEGITASLLALTEPGDEVLLPSPSYTSYQGAIAAARCTARFFPLDEEHNFDFSLSAVEEHLGKKTKVLLYCSPNNPTGTLFSEKNTRELMKLATKHNLFIVSDEVYKDFFFTEYRHFTAASIPEIRNRFVRVCSFSKAFAMTGWRVGFLQADSKLTEQILKFHDALVTCAPVASQYAAIAALRHGAPLLDGFRAEYRTRRDYTITRLDELSHVLDYQLPLATYFVFPRVKDSFPLAKDSRALAYDILAKAHLALVPGIAFGPTGEGHLRMNFGRDETVLKEGLNRFANYFSQKPLSVQKKKAVQPPRILSQKTQQRKQKWSHRVVQSAAYIFVKRTSPLIIGITGKRGKTVFKRTIADILSQGMNVHRGILSYSTTIGMPLSLLNLKSPLTTKEKILFPFKLFYKTFLAPCRFHCAIIEYSCDSTTDAKLFLSIAPPHWLVLTDVSGVSIETSSPEITEALKILAARIPSEKLLWSAKDEVLLSLKLPSEGALEPLLPEVAAQFLTGNEPPVGKSQALAVAAASRLKAALMPAPKR